MSKTQPAHPSAPILLGRGLTRRSALAGGLAASAALAWGGGSSPRPAAPALGSETAPAAEDELTLAVVNFQAVWGDVEANVATMQEVAEQAAAQGARLILFPEMSVTGYVWSDDEASDDSRMAIEAAEGPDGPVAASMARLAADLGAWIVYGATEPVPGDADHAYNSAFACSPDGTVSTYQKIHPVEGAWCTPGETPMVLETAWGRVGVDICYDTYAIPELERYYAAQGCRLVLNPTATSRGFDAETGDSAAWRWYFETRVKNIAIRDQVFVASANLAGYDGSHFTFPGGSSVWGPTGSDGTTSFASCPVGSTSDASAGFSVGTVDLSLATATDILGSENFRADLFASWYDELAAAGEDGLAAAPAETTATVCAVNFQPSFGDKEANFQSMSAYIEAAAEEGAGILVFPEMCLTGYAYTSEEGDANGQDVVDIAEPTDGEYALKVAALARENDMYIVFGTAEPVEGDAAHAYNSAFVCSPDGTVQAYRKIAPVEGPWCVAGSEPLVVETPYGALGVSICKDTYAYPEIARYYMAKGCVFVANPTARTGTADGWAELYENALENLADQDKVIVVSADLCGADLSAPQEQAGWDPYTGASVVTAPLAGPSEDGTYVRTWGSYASDPSATGLVSAQVDYADLWLGLGSGVSFFNPALYAELYRGEEFESTAARPLEA